MDLIYAAELLREAVALHESDGWEHGARWDAWAAPARRF